MGNATGSGPNSQRLGLFLEGVRDYAIFMLDAAGRVVSWNQGAERLFGYRSAEAIGQHFSRFFPPDQLRLRKPEAELEEAAARGQVEKESWHVRKDGTRFWAAEITTALRDERGDLHGFAKVLRDTTDRKQLEEELRRQAEELAEANRRKDEFLAMLSHELRNPLAPILNAVHIVRQRGLDAQGVQQAATMIERQARHMARLIDDLLEVTRITRGKVILHKECLDLGRLVGRAAESVRPLMEERRHRLSLAVGPEPLWVEADPTRVEQILVNLLHNAAKYTDPGGQIWLSARREGREVVLSVRDTGIGIAAEMLPRIFDLFAQADQSLERTRGGLGIGLTLIRNLVEMHGGSITASSAGLGQGSEFVVRLPAADRPDAVPPAAGPPLLRPARRLRMLVVDDNVDTATSLALLLRLHGHEVEVAHDGRAALETVRAFRPQVALLDIGLPQLDGYAVAGQIRKQAGLGDLILVAVTGYGYETDRERSRQAGFDYHLVKPVDPVKLEELVTTLAGQVAGGAPP